MIHSPAKVKWTDTQKMSKELSLLRDKMGSRKAPAPFLPELGSSERHGYLFLQRIWHFGSNCSSRSCQQSATESYPTVLPSVHLVPKDCHSSSWRKLFPLKPHPSPHRPQPFLRTAFVFLFGWHASSLESMLCVFRREVSSTSLHSDQLGKKKIWNAVADVQFKKKMWSL